MTTKMGPRLLVIWALFALTWSQAAAIVTDILTTSELADRAHGLLRLTLRNPLLTVTRHLVADVGIRSASCSNPYTVRSGDTLSAIAARCGVSVYALRVWNGLRSVKVWPGQALKTAPPPPTDRSLQPTPTPRIEPRPRP